MPEIIKYVSRDNLNEFAQEMNDKQKTIFGAKSTVDGLVSDVDTIGDALDQAIADIDLLDARVDNIASIPAGSVSTSADAELVDIRVGANGTTYPTAGDAVRGQYEELKNTLDAEVFYTQEMNAETSSSGWRLNESDGLCSSNSGYQLVKYPVTAGDIVKVVSDDRFQFQTIASVPTTGESNRVGQTYGVGTFILEVPATATYLIVSTPTTSNASVYSVTSIKDKVNAINSNALFIKNLIGTKGNVLYPVHIPQNSVLTMSTADGTAIGIEGLNIKFYNAQKEPTVVSGWNFNPAMSSRTFTYTQEDAYYVSWTKDAGKNVQLEFGDQVTKYEPYFLYTLDPQTYTELLSLADKVTINSLITKTFNSSFHTGAQNFYEKCKEFSSFLLGDTINNIEAPNDFETFLFFTDPHLLESYISESECCETITQIQKYYNSTPTTFCLCGGDWIGNSDLPDDACFKLGYVDGFMHSKFDNCYLLVGNHDTNYQGKKDEDSATYTTRLSIQSIADLWYRTEGKPYFTFNGAKTKFYCFDSGTESEPLTAYNGYGWEQCTWFARALMNEHSPHIAVAMHSLYDFIAPSYGINNLANEVLHIAEAYNAGTSISVNGTTFDFSNVSDRGMIEFGIFGHAHTDITTTVCGIPCLVTTWVGAGGTVATFDLVFVDYDNRQIKTVRVGYGADRTVSLASLS